MLYCIKNVSPTTILGIWRITESQEELVSQLEGDPELTAIISIHSPVRRLEKLAVRRLFKEILGYGEFLINYYPSGKPYLRDIPFNISISHSRGYVAIILDKEHEVGVDIEQITPKIQSVKSRIVSDKEYVDPKHELAHLLLHWSAKEVMFKILGFEGVNYLSHLFVQPFTPDNQGVFQARESRSDLNLIFDIHYTIESDFVLTYSILDKYEKADCSENMPDEC